MGEQIGIAMVGCGQIAEAHLKGVTAIEGARLVCCVDSVAKCAQAAADRYQSLHWTTDYAEALDRADVDAVVLCLPHDLHLPFSVAAAEAGKHVLVEKPMALNEAEAQKMVAAADRAQVQLSVGQSTRFLNPFQVAKGLMDDIGSVVQVMHQRTFWIDELSTDWRRLEGACGGLYLPLFGSHDVDAILWLLNDQPSQVWGAVRAVSHVSEGDSDGFIGLEFADGKLGSLAFSVRCKQTRSETVFVGIEGTLVVKRNAVLLNGEDVDLPEAENAFVRQMRAFVDALLAGGETPTQGREVLKVMRTLDLVRVASDSGTAVMF
ncbi:MAG: Gfo/Idh/MocA family oxidoreductase [Candidatus Latescibacteria bacterium]|nr:Gfo/Idh/MocA family oxidoreductase [Candidatus Latescibacterota bacterium]